MHHGIRLASDVQRPRRLTQRPPYLGRTRSCEARSLRAESSRILARDQTQIRCDTRGSGETSDIIDCGDESGGRDGTDSRNGHQPRHPLVSLRQHAQLGVGFYKDAGARGEQAHCRRCGEPYASLQMVRDLTIVERELGFRYELPGANGGHYQEVCPKCRRALFGLAQGAAWRTYLNERDARESREVG